MSRPKITIHNVETNEITEREMTVAEFKDYEKRLSEKIAARAEAEAKEAERQAILDRLGITADEAKLILG